MLLAEEENIGISCSSWLNLLSVKLEFSESFFTFVLKMHLNMEAYGKK